MERGKQPSLMTPQNPPCLSVWVQVLDRAQQHYKLVTIPVEAFQSEEESPQLEEEKHLSPQPCVLWEESSNTFLNVSNHVTVT